MNETQLRKLDGTRLKFSCPLWLGAETVMADFAQTNLLQGLMVGSTVTIVTLDDIPVKFIKDESGLWRELYAFRL